MTAPILSIITVCYNAREEVQKTMDNILSQSFPDFEYLVIDGGSADQTPELLEAYAERFQNAGIPFRFLSEPDQGIYDAMNKGTRMASGEWLLFLNAGDLFASEKALEEFFSPPSNAQILYGDTICVYQGSRRLYPALPLKNLTYEMPFCHQSAFIKRELLLEKPYDASYKVCADHKFFLSMLLQEKSFEYRPIPVSVYEIAGFSDRNKLLSHKEKQRMQKELGVFHFSAAWLFRELSFYCKQGIKNLLGQKLIDKVRKSRLH